MIGIAISLILGAAAIGLASMFWDDIVQWMKRAITKIQETVNGVLHGSKILIRKISEGIKEISRHYARVEDHWEETTVTKIVSESEVPNDIRQKAKYSEDVDITEELELELSRAN